jgi:acyl carrier protein
MDALPLTPSGKINRGALPSPLASALEGRPAAPTGDAKAGDPAATVLDICRDALGAGKLTADGKLDDAGMDSTGLISIIAGIESTFGITLDDGDITPEHFDTVRSIAALVESKRVAAAAAS